MTKEELQHSIKNIDSILDELYGDRRAIIDEYIKEHQPCHRGDIVKLTYIKDEQDFEIVGWVIDNDFFYEKTCEFRPSLCAVSKRLKRKYNFRIYYDGHAPIKSIEVLVPHNKQ